MLGANPDNAYADTNTLLGGYVEQDVAGSANLTLSDEVAMHAQIEMTGLLSANIDVIVPDWHKFYCIINSTTGAYTLTVKTSAGTGVAVTQGKTQQLRCDGTDVKAAAPEV